MEQIVDFESDLRTPLFVGDLPSRPLRYGPVSPAERARLSPPLQNQCAETIRPLIRAEFPLPLKRRRYKDDIRLEPCKPAILHLAGGQRKGVREPRDRCFDREHHVCCALKGNLPLSVETPMPSEAIRAIEFTRSTPGDKVWRFGMFSCAQLKNLPALAPRRRLNGMRAFVSLFPMRPVISILYLPNNCFAI